MEEFEKHYDGKEIERKMQEYWEKIGVYKFVRDNNKPLFSVDTPPPTVNGKLHIGHIFSYTQAEIAVRYKRMTGHNVYYPFGFDDNGLPSERLVERENNIKASETPRSEFCKKCVETTQKYEQEFKTLWKSMGFSCDWNLTYSTINADSQKLSQKLFIDLAKNSDAYIKESPVLFCTECQTSIAQSELDSKEVDSTFNYLAFKAQGKTVEIATTRPELLYGVVCVFVNPKDKRYKDLVGKNITVPLYNFEVPVLTDTKVDIDKGTGAVMCATFGDTTDVEWFENYKLPYKKVILTNGHIAEDVPFIANLKTLDARREILKLLREQNLLLREEKIRHTVSTHERCGTEVEIIPSRQWYISVCKHKDKLLELGDKIKWNPDYMHSRYVTWVDNLKWDWCISRQRYFGVPFPVYYCAKCGKVHFAREEDLPVNPLETPYIGTCECGSKEFLPESAVLDTWATSSITPSINRQIASKFSVENHDITPMSLRVQAHEIIRTWAFYTIVRSMYQRNDIPWKEMMISGIVLAKPGEKISKSKGNAVVSPQELISRCTADYIRYGTANVKLGTDTFFDEQDIVDVSKRFITKLWNSCKFVLSHLTDFDPKHTPKIVLSADKWIIEKTKDAVLQAKKYLDEYEIGLARKAVDDLFWSDFCDNYIEIVKDRLYKPELHGEEERKSAQYAIFYAMINILKMYAIYVPHLTEYIYQKGFKEFVGIESIHQMQWENPQNVDDIVLKFGTELTSVVFGARKYKTENGLSMRTEMEGIDVKISKDTEEMFKSAEKDLLACTCAKKINYIKV